MKVHGDYYRDGYAHLQGLMSRPVVHEIVAQLSASLKESEVPLSAFMREGMMLKRPALEVYAQQYKPMLTFLYGLTPIMNELTKKESAPRYFMWVMKWFFVSVSLRLCGLVSKLLKFKPTATEQNHRDTEAQRRD